MADTKAPERIWAGKYHGTFWQERPHHQMTEYVRADIHDAASKRRDELAAEVERLKADRLAADHSLVDRYRKPGSGIFSFPEDVAAIVRALDKAEAERDRLAEQYTTACKIIDRIATERDAALARAGAAAVDMRERALVAVSKSDSQEMDICGAAAIAIRIATIPIPTDAQAALDKLLREAEQRGQIKAGGVFADNDPEARYIEDMQNACPACEGSGHKDDAQAVLDKLIADARAEGWRAGMEDAARTKQTPEYGSDWLGMTCAILARINEPQEGGK